MGIRTDGAPTEHLRSPSLKTTQGCVVPHPFETINYPYEGSGIAAKNPDQVSVERHMIGTLDPIQQTTAKSSCFRCNARQDGSLHFRQAGEHLKLLLSRWHCQLFRARWKSFLPKWIGRAIYPTSGAASRKAKASKLLSTCRCKGRSGRRNDARINKVDEKSCCRTHCVQFRFQIDAEGSRVLPSITLPSASISGPKQQGNDRGASSRNGTKWLPPFGYGLRVHPLPKHEKRQCTPYSDGIPIESTALKSQSSRKTPHQTCPVSADSGGDRTPFSPTSCGPHARYEVLR